MFIRYRWAVFVALVVFMVGCGQRQEDIIPESNLPTEKQQEIRKVLQEVNYKEARYKLKREYGEDAVPFMIERVIQIYKKGSDWKYPELYSVASNLILSLGEIGDRRATAALKLWLTDRKYRVFRAEAAYALGELGDSAMIEPLLKIWQEEKGYLENGDDEGPWPFAGYHPSGCYVHHVLGEIGQSLFKLDEKSIVGELIEVAKISYNRWSSGY